MIKKFEPKKPDFTDDKVNFVALIKKGEFQAAIKIGNRIGNSIVEYPDELRKGIQKLIVSKRSRELLSYINKYPSFFDVDVVPILRAAYEIPDYHAFLKNCVRFKITFELKDEISHAMSKIRREEAISWLSKFKELGLTGV